MFRIFDLDESGSISPEEMRTILSFALTDARSQKEIDEIFQKMDSDGNGEISYEEFLAHLHQLPEILNCVTLK